MKPVVVGIVFKRDRIGFIRILTQLRLVQNKTYDPLYDRTFEAMGETIESGESVTDALLRGIAEECGKPGFKPLRIHGTGGKTVWTTGKKDSIVCCEPLCFVQSMGPPQPWIGPVFAVEVPSDFEPDHSKSDGEAGQPRWWTPKEMLSAIQHDPSRFMGLHMPALEKFCIATLDNKF